jgi:hypothetical protein
MMEWYHQLEQEVVPLAFKAAAAISAKIKYAQLELENGSLSLVIPFHERLAPADWAAVQQAVRSAVARVVADPARLTIRLRPEVRYFYTRHLEGARQTPNVFGSLHDIPRFTIPSSAIVGLRRTYDLLFTEAEAADYVATTALGGIPALTYLVRRLEDEQRPGDQNEWPPFYDSLRSKFHLFPGLNWSGTDKEKTQLFDWLAARPSGSSVLLFDTGTSGNGVRQMANLVRNRVNKAVHFGPGVVRIIGVVDGSDSSQRDSNEKIEAANRTVNLLLTFERVPKMLTEDCQELVGYTSLRREMMVKPLRANAVVEVTDDDGRLLFSCGALGADSLLRSVVQMRRSDPTTDEGRAALMNQVISFAVAHFSIGKEYAMLQNAFESGLIDEKTAAAIKDRMVEKYRESMAGMPPQWDFDEKEMRHQGKGSS